MITSISIDRLNKMPKQKLLFGDGMCDICGADEPTANIGAINYCQTCFSNRMDNKWRDQLDYE